MYFYCLSKRVDCGENVRTPHGIARVWPEPGKEPSVPIWFKNPEMNALVAA